MRERAAVLGSGGGAMRQKSSIFRLRNVLLAALLSMPAASAAQQGVTYVSQGWRWTSAARADFYTRDQGSQIIPLAWARALKRGDGQPFLADGLARYGYLPNPSNASGLPVGFMAGGPAGAQLAMNCSACHTRQITVDNREYRIDGAPAIVDFEAFLTDLDAAVAQVLASPAAFGAFAASVLGANPSPARVAELRAQVEDWYRREHAMIERAVRGSGWGLGRLDAVSMIFNRVSGLDIGPPPSFLIEHNIQRADAPVRYPFLWNAPRQDRTQWPGFAQNGNDLLGLARNLGQVYGVYGRFRPRRNGNRVDFLADNSANFPNLERLETLVERIGPPRWRWASRASVARAGEAIFNRGWQQGGCAECHGERRGAFRFTLLPTWATPLCDVGTDSRQYQILARTADTGVFQGARRPFGTPVGAQAKAFDLLGLAVVGSIFQRALGFSLFSYDPAASQSPPQQQSALARQILSIYSPAPNDACDNAALNADFPFKYESRVLQGIWATAPYLHNGSVPTLADLLSPGLNRPSSFALGRRYDLDRVGLAADQGPGAPVRTTTCEERDSGNSRCGHEYGVSLSETEKAALLEYLRTL
ncbi:MAG TPA: di-heme-cytochrome C peroxidase [Allosphingosinicella sp.]|nr:di-heme-cytochrome C peroxidase [Allosphingosinicella sp.]